MDRASFERWLSRFAELDTGQQHQACRSLASLLSGESTAALIDKAALCQLSCPRCESSDLHRDGRASGLQRYRCKTCRRSFNGLTGTPLARLRLKERWLDYCACLRDPACTVHSAAKKVGIHPNTSFRWRHRFLERVKDDRPCSLQGVVEVDEALLLESQKGGKQLARPARKRGGGGITRRRAVTVEQVAVEQVSFVVARDRAGGTVDFIAGRGALRACALEQHLLPVLESDVLLVSDGNRVYRRFARKTQIAHRAVNVRQGQPVCGPIHVHNVNAYHCRFKQWLRHFNGVATRYLRNYLGWRWAIDMNRIDSSERWLRAAMGVFPN